MPLRSIISPIFRPMKIRAWESLASRTSDLPEEGSDTTILNEAMLRETLSGCVNKRIGGRYLKAVHHVLGRADRHDLLQYLLVLGLERRGELPPEQLHVVRGGEGENRVVLLDRPAEGRPSDRDGPL